MEVVAAVIRDGERVLACRRRPERPAGGKWEFPGGKVEPGESPEQALEREIAEELGVHVRIGALVDRTTTDNGARLIDLACYEAWLLGAPPTGSTDHDELRWVTPAQTLSLKWTEPDWPAVRLLTAGPSLKP